MIRAQTSDFVCMEDQPILVYAKGYPREEHLKSEDMRLGVNVASITARIELYKSNWRLGM